MAMYLVRNVFLLLAYLVVGKCSLLLAIPPNVVSPVWPAAGIALAGILIGGYRYLPGVFLGAVILQYLQVLESGHSIFSNFAHSFALPIAIGAMLQAAFSAYIVKQAVTFPNKVEDEKDIVNLIVRGGLIGCIVNATIGTYTIMLAGLLDPEVFLINWFNWWVGDAIGVIMVTPIILIAVADGVTKIRKLAVIAPVLCILAIAIFVFAYASNLERQTTIDKFNNITEHKSDLLRDQMKAFTSVLLSIEMLYKTRDHISRAEFTDFVSGALKKHDSIQALEWVPRVPHEDRGKYIQQAIADGYANFSFKETSDSGMREALHRKEYYPVYYLEPLRGNRPALGFDLGSNPDRLKTLEQARDTGQPAATTNIYLVQDDSKIRGLLIFAPVYKRGADISSEKARQKALKGFALGVFQVRTIVNSALKKSSRKFSNLAIYETTSQAKPVLLYGKPVADSMFKREVPMNVGGKDWVMVFTPTAEFLRTQHTYQTWLLLTGGLLFSSMLQLFLLSLTARNDVVRRLIGEQSQRLLASEKRHRAVFDNAGDGLIVMNSQGYIESFNPSSERMFNYEASEVIGQSITKLMPECVQNSKKQTSEEGALQIRADLFQAGSEISGKRKDGSQFPLEITISELDLDEDIYFSCILRDVSERKISEEKLVQLSSQMELIFNNAGEGICGIDLNGVTTFANKKALDMLGYSLEEMLNKPQHDLIHHHYPNGVPYPKEHCKIFATFKDGAIRTEDKEVFWRKDGIPVSVEYTSNPIRNKNGDISGAVIVFKDIRERKESERKLEEAYSFQDLIMQNVPAMIFIKDEQFRIIQANQEFLNIYPEALQKNVLGTTTLDEYDLEDAEKFLEQDRIAFRHGYSETESTVDCPDGKVRTLYTKKVRFTNTDGDHFILGLAHDITELRRIDKELLEAEYAREAYAEAADDGFWDWFINEDYEYISPRFWEMLGYDPAEKSHTPQEWHKVLFDEDLQLLKNNYQKHVETLGRHPFHQEVRYRHKNGSTVYAICKGKVVEWDGEGNPLRMIGTQTDITNIKVTETNLIRSNLELERFAYVASHDLQEPLRMVSSFSQLIQDEYNDTFDDMARKYMGFIQNAAIRMQELVRDLLEYSRAAQDLPKLDTVECGPLLDTVIGALSDVIKESNADITFDDLPTVQSNAIRISRLLQNLIGNSIKYRKTDIPPKIHVSARETETEWVFSVSDNGIGMKKEYLDQIFILFNRLHSKDEYSGTGIGLSICKKIAESIGGRIWVESEFGEGSTFYFSVPKGDSGREAA